MKRIPLLTILVLALGILAACAPAAAGPVQNQTMTVIVAPSACTTCAKTAPQPTTAPVVVSTPVPQPEIPVQNNDGEINCTHVNGGVVIDLEPGYSANGGHLFVGKTEYLYVDDKVVVVRNESNSSVSMTSTDGFGLCSSSDFRLQTIVRFSEGCDSNGCSAVKDVDLTNSGVKVNVIKEDAYCGQHSEEVFCQ